jgi:hypothetical protein
VSRGRSGADGIEFHDAIGVHVKADIERALQPLIGETLWGPGRAANMLSLQIGPVHAAPTQRSPDREVGAFSLHVFCPWRLTRASEIVVGSGDLHTPADPDADLEDFDWESPDSTWWDVGMREVFGNGARVSLVVQEVVVDDCGGFVLRCTGDFVFAVFPNSAPAAHVETEFWRVIAAGDGRHTVMSSAGLHRDA